MPVRILQSAGTGGIKTAEREIMKAQSITGTDITDFGSAEDGGIAQSVIARIALGRRTQVKGADPDGVGFCEEIQDAAHMVRIAVRHECGINAADALGFEIRLHYVPADFSVRAGAAVNAYNQSVLPDDKTVSLADIQRGDLQPFPGGREEQKYGEEENEETAGQREPFLFQKLRRKSSGLAALHEGARQQKQEKEKCIVQKNADERRSAGEEKRGRPGGYSGAEEGIEAEHSMSAADGNP